MCLESVCDSPVGWQWPDCVAQTPMTRRDGVSSSTNHMHVCVSAEEAVLACPVGIKGQSDHQVCSFKLSTTYPMMGSPQEDLVSYLDLSCGYLQGD